MSSDPVSIPSNKATPKTSISHSPPEYSSLLVAVAKTPCATNYPVTASASNTSVSVIATPSTTTVSTVRNSELKRKPSLHVVLPKFGSQIHNGSSDSLNKSPHSPGSNLGDEPTEEKELSYKVQRKNYRKEKQRVAQELTTALKDPSIIILTGSLKVRGKLKGWTKLWAVLKPGLLLLYKSNKLKSSHWVATVLLNCCKVIERPSKKDGFCFKVFHPLEQSIWAAKGPEGEAIGAVVQPLPTTYLICRAPSADQGKCWMDGLELALTCSSLLVRSPRSDCIMDDKASTETENETDLLMQEWSPYDGDGEGETEANRSNSEDTDTSHVEEHPDHSHESDFDPDHDGDGNRNSLDENGDEDVRELLGQIHGDGVNADTRITEIQVPSQSNYSIRTEEVFSSARGEHTEVLGDENKSLLWFLVKQVRPGMDLSRVVLPTFILEPRSFLDKLTDYYYHANILSQAVTEDDAFTRMKSIVRWYLSGFYKKPKGLKKPYNPVLGETFRCMWEHPNKSKTFYLAEQVSHHPPVSALYVSNKKDGFVISAAILAKSKFYGNSTSAILEGQATLTLLPRGEIYTITMPFAHCKGILVGTLSMELGGTVNIVCDKTGYSTEIEFKLKSFLGRADTINAISGKIKLGRETLATFDGHWDNKITIKDKRTSEEAVLWEVTDAVKANRLKRYTMPLSDQSEFESENLWIKVSEAIHKEDQEAATVEKTKLEERQRMEVKLRREMNEDWVPKYFAYDGATWRYKHEDLRPWDDRNDVMEFEDHYVIQTLRRLNASVGRNALITMDTKRELRRSDVHVPKDQVVPAFNQRESNRQLIDLLRQLLARQLEQSEQIAQLKSTVASIQAKLSRPKPPKEPFPITNTVLGVVFAVAMQILMVIYWFGDGKLFPDITRKKS